MKKQSSFQQTPPFDLRPASVEEAGLFYSNDERDEALGTVGHLRMNFGSGGKGFYHTWWPHNEDRFNTPEFKEALQEFVDAMRQSGPLKNLAAMNTYCWHNGGEISENDRVYEFVAETEHYRFCLRCTPRPGDYQGYPGCLHLMQTGKIPAYRTDPRADYGSNILFWRKTTMKFYVHRDPNNKLQMIPYVALQMSKLADADGLLLDVGEGTILLSRGEMSTRETMKMVSHLEQMSVDLVKQLTEASYKALSCPEGCKDPLDEFDEDVIENLMGCGADLDGLRMLLLQEEAEDE